MDNLDIQNLDEMLNTTLQPPKEGEIIKGLIVGRTDGHFLVDLGLKSEGVLPVEEFDNPEEVKIGEPVYVYLEAIEGPDGLPVISKKKADFEIAWNKIKEESESGDNLPAKVIKKVKGGLIVDIFGIEAFLPASQIDIKLPKNMDALIGKEFRVKIVKVNWAKRNIVVSRRKLIEEEQERKRREVLSRIKVGDVVEVVVKSITNFGAFVDLDGMDALLHISDLSWNKVRHPSEVVSPGQKIKVKVLNIDEAGRISVGLKHLTPHPWDLVEEKYPIGSRVKGKVTTIVDYGAFVELEKGVEGLIHVSEMSWTKNIKHPSEILKVGDEVEAIVLNIDKENRRISLGLKQTKPDPWALIDEKYSIGDRVKGKVKSLREFGAFVEIEEGVEGLIHNSDLSWTKRIKHPREVLKKGETVEAIILNIDKVERKIALGYKQTKPDPYYLFTQKHKEGDVVKARVIDLPTKGVVVDLGYGGLEGFVPASQLAKKEGQKVKDAYKIGQELTLKIKKIDLNARRIILSEKALLYDTKREADRKYKEAAGFKKPKFTLKDHLEQ